MLLFNTHNDPRGVPAVRQKTVIPKQTITKNGTVRGTLNLKQIGKSLSTISLVLCSGGVSTSFTATYQLGFIKDEDINTGTLTKVRQNIGADIAIPDFTALDLTSQTDLDGTTTNCAQTSMEHPATQFLEFIVKENNVSADTIELYAIIMTEDN